MLNFLHWEQFCNTNFSLYRSTPLWLHYSILGFGSISNCFFPCIANTSSRRPPHPPPVDVPLTWELTWSAGQMKHGVCLQQEICPGHHGSAHWQLVHPCSVFLAMCVCVCACVFCQLNCLWRSSCSQTWVQNLVLFLQIVPFYFTVCSSPPTFITSGILHCINYFHWLLD